MLIHFWPFIKQYLGPFPGVFLMNDSLSDGFVVVLLVQVHCDREAWRAAILYAWDVNLAHLNNIMCDMVGSRPQTVDYISCLSV